MGFKKIIDVGAKTN